MKIVKVSADEFTIKRAEKESNQASLKGEKVAFDLRGIKDRKEQAEVMMKLSGRK